MGKLQTHSFIYYMKDNSDNRHNLKHTVNWIYLTSILYIECRQISLHNNDNDAQKQTKNQMRLSGRNVFEYLHSSQTPH